MNQSFFKKFDSVEPWRTRENMFLLFDFVHLMKNIRNNWITEATQELKYEVDGETKTAKWADLKKLHHLESSRLVKLSKLTEVSVAPKPIERQKVSTVLEVFHEKTIAALKEHDEIENADGAVDFLELILEFWNIVNVKSPYADIVLLDPLRAAINSPDDANLQKLLKISAIVEKMGKKNTEGKSGKREKELSKDTANAFSNTCRGLVELSNFLITHKNYQYVLLGKFTSDHLEKEFGKLRQGSGGTYFITVQQALEKIAISKTRLLLLFDPLALQSVQAGHQCNISVVSG